MNSSNSCFSFRAALRPSFHHSLPTLSPFCSCSYCCYCYCCCCCCCCCWSLHESKRLDITQEEKGFKRLSSFFT